MRLLNRLLMLCLLPLALLARAAPGDPVAAGRLTAPIATYVLVIYYPTPPTKDPRAVLKASLAAGRGLPKAVSKLPVPPAEPVVQAIWETDAGRNYAPPSPEMVKLFGHGLSDAQAKGLQGARQALILAFAHPAGLPAYRASMALSEQVARDTGGLLWDDESREVFTPEAWRERRLASWQDKLPDVTRHTVIHAYAHRGGVRAVTLGMAKFGLPDLVVHGAGWSANDPAGNLINALAQTLVEGGRPFAAGQLDLDLAAIRHDGVRQHQTSRLKAGATSRARLRLAQALRDDGDPDNTLIEIGFDAYAGADGPARQQALLHALYGAGEDTARDIRHDDAIREASRQARARLPALQKTFARGLQPGEYLLVKAPFPIPGGGREWMWVEVTAWAGDAITGLLQNQPRDIPGLQVGQKVQVKQAEVFDYLHRDANGREEGNTTGKLIQAQSSSGR